MEVAQFHTPLAHWAKSWQDDFAMKQPPTGAHIATWWGVRGAHGSRTCFARLGINSYGNCTYVGWDELSADCTYAYTQSLVDVWCPPSNPYATIKCNPPRLVGAEEAMSSKTAARFSSSLTASPRKTILAFTIQSSVGFSNPFLLTIDIKEPMRIFLPDARPQLKS